MIDLRKLAEAATKGSWGAKALPRGEGARSFGHYIVNAAESGYPGAQLEGVRSAADAAYIAACSPDRILALLDERDTLRAVAEAARRAATEGHAPMYSDGPVYRACPCAVHSALRAALDKLDEVTR